MNTQRLFLRFIATALSLAVMIGFTALPANVAEAQETAGSFVDVRPSDYFFEAVEELASSSIILGFEDKTFRPNQSISREQASKILALALGLEGESTVSPVFNDVKSSDYYYPYISALAKAGILEGDGDGSFNPRDTLTRAQIAKMLSKAFALGEQSLEFSPFTDVKSNDWFAKYIPSLIANGITNGITASSFDPDGEVSRAQMAAFVFRCKALDPSIKGSVYVGQAVSAAVLSIYDTDGALLFTTESAATNEQGSFVLEEIKGLPSDFRVVTESGFLAGEAFSGRLSADIRNFRPYNDTIYINVVTSIVSAYLDSSPDISLSEAVSSVKRFLDIPETMDIGSGAQLSSKYFNNSQFLREAEENGGIDNYIDMLISEIHTSDTHPFQEELPQGGAAWIATTLAEGAVSYVGGELMGWGLDKAGISFGEEDHTAEELAKINDGMAEMKVELTKMSIQLDAISSKLDSITNQLKDMLKQISHKLALNEYGTRVGQLNTLISSVDSIQRDLKNFVNNPPANPETARQSLINRIERNIIDQADVIHNQLVGVGGQKPLLTLWQETVYENRFLDWEDYGRIEAQFDYFRQYQEAILLLQVEYYHATEGKDGENAAIILECIDKFNSHMEQQEKLLPLPIEKFTVVDCKNDKMYYSDNIEFGNPSSSFTVGGKTKVVVSAYMQELAASNYAGFTDWKPMDSTGLTPLVADQYSESSPWWISEHLINNGWPGQKYTDATVIPFTNFAHGKNFEYLLYTSYEFKRPIAYPDTGIDQPGLALLMVYRDTSANDFGYQHLK